MDLRFVPTIRGGENAIIENYKFRLKKKNGDKWYWACAQSGCKSSCVTRQREGLIKVRRPI